MPGRILLKGYTTGTCAQAAVKAAVWMLFTGEEADSVKVELPKGAELKLDIIDICMEYEGGELAAVSCAVKKDSGDDPDITNGVYVYGKVIKTEGRELLLEGGQGIGKVTKPGLEQEIGSAAINRVPRQMIMKEVRDACEETGYSGGLKVVVSIPKGEELALKTFNPRLGIEGGLSILGTSGIVDPMSEQALIETIRLDIKVKLAAGNKCLIVTPGNYGLDFLWREYGIVEEHIVKCSNFIGCTLDMAVELGCERMLLAGHIGKLIKIAGGIMNTHSKEADCRMEILAGAVLRAGISGEKAFSMLECLTTDDALAKCTVDERERIMHIVMGKMQEYIEHRTLQSMKVEVVTFSNLYGILGQTEGAHDIAEEFLKKS